MRWEIRSGVIRSEKEKGRSDAFAVAYLPAAAITRLHGGSLQASVYSQTQPHNRRPIIALGLRHLTFPFSCNSASILLPARAIHFSCTSSASPQGYRR